MTFDSRSPKTNVDAVMRRAFQKLACLALLINLGATTASTSQTPKTTNFVSASLILPGRGLGNVNLGDSKADVLKYFHFKPDMDSEFKWTDLRFQIHWLDLRDKLVQGEVTFSFRDGRVFQIDSAAPRFRTPEGITVLSQPSKVKQHYGGMKAYLLAFSGGSDVGGRDLIYWVSLEKGIAFELRYHPKTGQRLVHDIAVFEARTEFLPRGSFVAPPQKWVELPAYSLEPPPDMPVE